MQKAGRQKRPRALQACEVCRARKNRCSEDRPCTYCVEHDLECTYSRAHRDKRQRPQLPGSRFEHHATAIDIPRFTEGGIPGTIDFRPNNVNQTTNPDHPEQHSRSSTVGRTQQQTVESSRSTVDVDSRPSSTVAKRDTAFDVMDTYLHTSNLEFYGSASSVAFLRHVETLSNTTTTDYLARPPERSLASPLHTPAIQPKTSRSMPAAPKEADSGHGRFYFREARRFLDAYFSNIHPIQPLFDEEGFLARCEDLWFDRPDKQPLSFVALYYATLSLGSLIMTSDISGSDRFAWGHKLFNQALGIVTQLGTATDIEMAQYLYMMSKICQHELNPHVAYLYSGQAARTALAIGINRRPISPDAADPQATTAASKTWWAVYCLDIQTSFALGRPDSLGPDQYHTQYLPTAPVTTSGDSDSNSHILQIVPHMVDLSRIMRRVALDLYTQPCEMEQKLRRAKALDTELQDWLERVPSNLRSEHENSDLSLKPRRLANYIKKQSVVLRLRYLNLRMVAHAVFMIDEKIIRPNEATSVVECRCRCLDSAEAAIDLIYSTYRTDDYFQTWWYNTTYTLYAVSVLLALVFRQLARTQQALENLFAHIDRAIMVLQAMDDCLIARNAVALIKRTLARARKVPQPALIAQQISASDDTDINGIQRLPVDLEHETVPNNVDTLSQPYAINNNDAGEAVGDLDWLSSFDDSQQALFWTEWAHEIDTLGT